MEKINKENSFVYEAWLKEFDKVDNLAEDWLIKSWSLKDEDKTISLCNYSKANKSRKNLIDNMVSYSSTHDIHEFESVGEILKKTHLLNIETRFKKYNLFK